MSSKDDIQLPHVLVAIYRGVIYQKSAERLWDALIRLQAKVADHTRLLGLQLVIDEAEGFAHLRQREPEEGEPELPRLIRRHPLGYPVSVLVVLLRKKLVEHDAHSSEERLVLTSNELKEMLQLFLPDGSDEVRAADKIAGHVKKVVELGFLRPLRGEKDSFEVARIIKSFVDAQLLGDFEKKLTEYRDHAIERIE